MSSTDHNNSPGSAVPRQGNEKPFWPVSLGIHLVALGLLVFVPAKQYFEQERQERKKLKPEIKRRGKELDEVMAKIRDITAERLEGKVALLDAGQDRMADNFEILNKHYQPYADQQREVAMARMVYYADDTVEWMNSLRKELQESAQVKDAAKLDSLMKVSDDIGNKILVGQEEIRRGLMFLDPDNEKLIEKQAAAEEGQIRVSQFLGWGLDTARSVLDARKRIEELKKEIPSLERDLREVEREIKQYEQRVERQSKKVKNVRDRMNSQEARKNKDLRERLQKQREREEKELQKVKRGKGNIFDRRRELTRDVEQAKRELASLEENLKKNEKDWPGKITVARNVQEATFYKQRDVVNTLYKDADREPILTDE